MKAALAIIALLLPNIIMADEVGLLSQKMIGCISEKHPDNRGVDWVSVNSTGARVRAFEPSMERPNEKNSPDGFYLEGVVGWHLAWLAIVDTTTQPPIFYETFGGKGPLFRQFIHPETISALRDCGLEFGGPWPKVSPHLTERARQGRASRRQFARRKLDEQIPQAVREQERLAEEREWERFRKAADSLTLPNPIYLQKLPGAL